MCEVTRATVAEVENFDAAREVEDAIALVNEFIDTLVSNLNERMKEAPVITKMREVFKNWNTDSLESLLSYANDSGKNYGELPLLEEQHLVLKNRFAEVKGKDEMEKWLKICTIADHYVGLSEILHLALSCFVKSPLQATAESIGSVINQHGRKQRFSLKPSSLSNEVQIAWNGPQEFDHALQPILREALQVYFSENQHGIRFYLSTKIKVYSSTLLRYMAKTSRILF